MEKEYKTMGQLADEILVSELTPEQKKAELRKIGYNLVEADEMVKN